MSIETLAEAAILLRPDLSLATLGVAAAGKRAGQQYADGFYRDAAGKLRAANGRFATDAERQMIEGGKRAGTGFGAGVGSSATKALLPIGVAIGAIGIKAIKMAADYQTLTTRLVTSAGEQHSAIEMVRKGILAMSGEVGDSAQELAKAMYIVESGGRHGAEGLQVLRAAAEGAKAEGADLTTVADALTSVLQDYHLKGSDAARVTSQMVAAVGAGKTTFEQFSGSLHSVLPIASSAGIKFSDVAASIASMTVHGQSAEQATQNLADTIKHLLAPTGVQVAELGQLGLTAGDLKDSLGQRGLNGTLQFLSETILKHMGPSGRVLTSAFNQSRDAANDANQMFKNLPPNLQALAKDFKDGNETAGGWRKTLNALPPTQANLLRQWAAMQLRASGFSNILKSGGPAAQTYQDALRRVTGDATGLNVALQLTGENTAYVNTTMKTIAGATTEAGNHVRGWSDIQGTFNQKLSQFKASISAVVIELGTGLLPIAGDVIGAIGGMVTWFAKHKAVAEALGIALGVAGGAMLAYKTYTLATTVATKAAAAATVIWSGILDAIAFVQLATEVRSFAGAMVLLDAAMDANPIGIVVVALAALAAGIVYAWNHSETFRKVTLAVWGAIKTAVSATVSWFVNTVWPTLVKVWQGISTAARWAWEKVIRPAVAGLVAFVRTVLVPTLLWLWHNIIEPVAHAIGRIIQAASAVIELALAIVVHYVRAVLGPVFEWLWKNVVTPVMVGIKHDIQVASVVIRTVFDAVVNFLRRTLGPAFTWLYNNVIKPVWNGIKSFISTTVNNVVGTLRSLWNFITVTLPDGFRKGVAAIAKFWDALRAAAKAPIAFTVNHIINPVLTGFNKVAKAFNSPGIPLIAGFEGGGRIPGNPSPTDNRWAWLKDSSGNVLGRAGLATGEFVVNARDTAKALPLLQWINDGMRGGPYEAARRIGRPVTDMPGDGSEGWAFASGGLVGFLKDVYAAASNPGKLIKAPIEAMISQIPGAGALHSILVGMGQRLIAGLTNWLSSSSVVSAGIGGAINTIPLVGRALAARSFVEAQAGKPYIWASAGPRGYDCSGIVSAVYNVLKGRSPYSHTFSTESLPGHWFHEGQRTGTLIAGWSHPGQSPASRSTGHMAGQIGGLPFESRGSRGVVVGAAARRVGQFAQIGAAYNDGGLVRLAKIARADFGSVTLERGWNLVENGTGRREPLVTPGGTPARMHPDDILALAQAIGTAMGRELKSTIPATTLAARQIGKRPR